jgi:hypothetical protein
MPGFDLKAEMFSVHASARVHFREGKPNRRTKESIVLGRAGQGNLFCPTAPGPVTHGGDPFSRPGTGEILGPSLRDGLASEDFLLSLVHNNT